MILNYPAREIHLLPNSHFFDKFDYAYTGLGIYYENGKIIVGDIVSGSPGAIGKFKVGDEIFAVGNNFSHNISAYKNILQTVNEDIKVVVIRQGELMQLVLHPTTIK